jgi:ABC-type dipeptide/oligopeptide/nickel transport system permease component
MGRYLLQRLAGLVFVLLTVSAITFFLMHSIPGGPFDMKGGDKMAIVPKDVIERLNAAYGLDKPVAEQYLIFMKNAIRLDFGYSYYSSVRTITQMLRDQWPWSIRLGLYTLAFSMVVGLGLGILSAIKQGTWVDATSTFISMFCLVIPSFVFAVLLQFVVSVKLHLVPTSGVQTAQQWILPVLTNSLGPIATLQRFARSSMADVMRSNYVRTARAKGLSERRVMMVHVFKNALTPLVTVGGPMVASLCIGSFFVESIFRIPGVGLYWVQAISLRDYPMIMVTTMAWTFIILLTYLLTDLAYAAVDPRVTFVKEK